MQDKRLSMIVLLLVTLIALAIITGCIVRAIIAPPSIALIAPANGATGQATTLLLTWEATPGEAKNQKTPVTIIGYGLFFAPINEDYGAPEPRPDKQAEKTGLAYGATYKWKVAAVQSNGQTAESTERTFTTTNRLYGAPQIALTSPENGATNQATSVTLTWEATEGKQTNAGEREGVNITEYRVYHKKTGDPDPTEPATTTEKSYNLTNLEYAATYTWYVVALQSDGQQATSTESTFTTQAVQYDIPEIALKSPGNRVGGQPTTVNLTWEATPGKQTNVGERAPTIEGYLVYFGVYGQNYGDPEPVTATQTTKPGLAYGTTYKWQVVALQSNEKRATSTEWTFTTLAPVYGRSTIELKSPEDKATDLATPVRLEWVAAPGAQTIVGESAPYLLGFQVHYQKEGGAKVSDETGNQYYNLTDLDPEATYTWQVVAAQSDGQYATSTERTFKTGAGGTTGSIRRYSSSGDLKGKYDKLSDAINEADNEDHIVVVGGTILNNETQQVTIDATWVTIYSSDPGNPFTIDMGGGGSAPGSKRENSRVFHITNGASVTIRDAIIKGGDATDEEGGGIRITAGSTVTTINATITDNKAGYYGGGVYIKGSTFNAYGTTITGNTAEAEGEWVRAYGGGVAVLSGTFNAYENTTITRNAAKVEGYVAEAYGGGVAVWEGVFNAYEGTTITGNTAEAEGDSTIAYGGGLCVGGDGTINAYAGTTITGNTAEAEGDDAMAYGGGVEVWWGTFNATETTITENTAVSSHAFGGGVDVSWGTFNAYENTTITKNAAEANGDSAEASGGGVVVGYHGTFNAQSVEISGNVAKAGGGIFWKPNGVVRTNGQVWTPRTSKKDDFSVDTGGGIQSPCDTNDPVQVFENTADDGDSTQMKVE
ncbi:MAG TPA: hypothetical protein PK884_01215 [Thermotogota bacterium]|nr:hypothetical protein [Thermotogota bacterium]